MKPAGLRLGKPLAPPPASRLLAEQGDARLERDPRTGRNRYGCLAFPGKPRPCFGSATASSISLPGFEAIRSLHQRVGMAAPSVQAGECDRVRSELAGLCGVDALPGTEIVLAASGTDLHLLAAQLCAGSGDAPLEVVLSATPETGNGVPAALAGRYYNARAPFRREAPEGAALEGCRNAAAHAVAGRRADGSPRPIAEVDAETRSLVEHALAAGGEVLLITSDQSKTGLLLPSPALAVELKRLHGPRLTVFVDACQMRLCPETLRAYVGHGFVVGITGSKFATGPAFCGALLVPAELAASWRRRSLPDSLSDYSARADWPKGWLPREALKYSVNLGLLFRWQAALAEMHAFHLLPRPALAGFFRAFGAAVGERLRRGGGFEALAALPLDRGKDLPGGGWDALPTLFPFLLKRDGRVLDHDESRAVYLSVLERHGEIGQPAHCGLRDGRPLGALRLCASMRLAVDALAPGGRGQDRVTAEALSFLDAIAALAGAPLPAGAAR